MNALITIVPILLFFHQVFATRTPTFSCGPDSVKVRFPFRIRSYGYDTSLTGTGTGMFDLSCNNRSQTVINLSRTGSKRNVFEVVEIDYAKQTMLVKDPANCLARRFLNGDLSKFAAGDTFELAGGGGISYTVRNCSSEMREVHHVMKEPCQLNRSSDVSVMVAAVRTASLGVRRPCPGIGVDPVPVNVSAAGIAVRLKWRGPDCAECELRGGKCGYESGPGSRVECSFDDGRTSIPRSAKYGIIIGAGIPSLICFIGVVSYICSRIQTWGHRGGHTSNPEGSDTQPLGVVALKGLDGPTIESFPKIVLDESKGLPNPNDNTCPICLSEYQPKETLRTIPTCKHYFHAACVDEWLKMNATCPLCRNSPDGSSHVSPSTSISWSSRSLSPGQ